MKNSNLDLTRKKYGLSAVLGLTIGILGCSATILQAAPDFKVLDFWGVGGYGHDSRPAANAFLDSLGKANNFQVDASELASVFTPANLAQYKVVVMNNSTEAGKILNTDQRTALLDFMKKKGFVGMHGAGDTKGSWPEYTTFLGGELSAHGGGIAKLNIDSSPYAKTHPVMKGLLLNTAFDEEWYAYKTNPRLTPGVHVLYTLDESSCPNCTKMGGDHPIVWVREEPTGGRVFYYAMGHGSSIFKTNNFCKTMLKQAIMWAAEEHVISIRQIQGSSGSQMNIKSMAAAFTIGTEEKGKHTVQLRTMDGKMVAKKSGFGPQSYTFNNLKSGTVYSLVVKGSNGPRSQLVTAL
jgi:type 1 glutamine amidotransferase